VTDQPAVFDLHTAVLHDVEPGGLRFPCGLVVPNPLLHPDGRHVVAVERRRDDSGYLLARSEYLDDVDRPGNARE
jgi:hypothetical protein